MHYVLNAYILALDSVNVDPQPLHCRHDESATLKLARAFEHITESPSSHTELFQRHDSFAEIEMLEM